MEDAFEGPKGRDVSGVVCPARIESFHDVTVIADECNEGVPDG